LKKRFISGRTTGQSNPPFGPSTQPSTVCCIHRITFLILPSDLAGVEWAEGVEPSPSAWGADVLSVDTTPTGVPPGRSGRGLLDVAVRSPCS
jgi:hypothetical protein